MIVAYISLAISLGIGIWALRTDMSNKKFKEETKKEMKRHSEILRNSRP